MARRTLFYGAMIAALCAAPIASQSPQNFPAPPGPPTSAGSNEQLAQEAIGWLQGLVRINTTSPPGNEAEAAKYVSGILSKENIPNEVLEMTPGRSIVVARLNAGAMPNASRALLLLAHLDVVGVSREKWSVD